MNHQPSLKRNFVLSTLYRVLCILTPLLTTPYISRVLGPEGVGIYSYTSSIQLYFSMFAALGTASYGAREIAQSRADISKRSKLFWEIELLTVLTSLICLGVWLVWSFFNGGYRIYYLILSLELLATMMDVSWFFVGMEQFQYTVLQNSLFKILGTVMIFVLVRDSGDTALYVVIMSLTSFLGNISMWIYLPKFVRRIPLHQLRILRHFRETVIYFIPTIATSVYTVLDKTLIGAITKSESENGYYELASKIINAAKAVTFAGVNSVLESRNAWLFSEKKYQEIKEQINTSLDYIMFMGIGICFGLIAVANRFVPIFFGDGFEKTTQLLKLMSPLIVIVGVSGCLGSQYYNPAGLRKVSTKFIIAGACANFVLNLALIPRYRSIGATIATLIAEALISALFLKNCDGYVQAKCFAGYLWKKLLAGIIMLIVIKTSDLFLPSGLPMLIIQIMFGAAVYMLALFAMNDSFAVGVLASKLKNRFRQNT